MHKFYVNMFHRDGKKKDVQILKVRRTFWSPGFLFHPWIVPVSTALWDKIYRHQKYIFQQAISLICGAGACQVEKSIKSSAESVLSLLTTKITCVIIAFSIKKELKGQFLPGGLEGWWGNISEKNTKTKVPLNFTSE